MRLALEEEKETLVELSGMRFASIGIESSVWGDLPSREQRMLKAEVVLDDG